MRPMHRMLRPLVSSLLLTLCVQPPNRAWSQENQAPQDDKKAKATALLQEAYGLQTRKRYVDALTKIAEAEGLTPDNPEVYNLRGSIYLGAQMRDVAKARADFQKAQQLSPDSLPPRFNLAEADFVDGKFAEAEAAFRALTEKFDRLPQSMRHLLQFKILVSLVKQKKIAEAEAAMKEHFSFMDDTPAYYFAKAVIALEQKQDRVGNEWLAKAQIIFKKPDNAAYLDALMETHYIHTIDIPNGAENADAPIQAKP